MKQNLLSNKITHNIEIREIPAHACLPLRKAVLWPDKSEQELQLPQDNAATHFGAFLSGGSEAQPSEELEREPVGVVSCFQQSQFIQIRKFAVLQQYQGKGLGSDLLNHLISYYGASNAHALILDSRHESAAFYERAGFKKDGPVFLKYGLPFIKMRYSFQ